MLIWALILHSVSSLCKSLHSLDALSHITQNQFRWHLHDIGYHFGAPTSENCISNFGNLIVTGQSTRPSLCSTLTQNVHPQEEPALPARKRWY
ncbi:hypothetical protein CDAR_93351 [Caerostris darwini]|uniref:Uncharacterized protein n=1 Tax=Caerostris darwini TaxID=1538125 RepID=A0AAV4QDX0_9ARAC|nr:hypothetical protein CDAR_93351 [Caerostris darwini]